MSKEVDMGYEKKYLKLDTKKSSVDKNFTTFLNNKHHKKI